ncbi:calcitonin gene-related peptide type 1 receptor-like [Mytilus californianus]|uniref:calcitonin gene-related peptide type 1 receptor-like n=1 Tax=Mytilus californianus TaxID=6549 RepID=UPI0022457905|nr:calcitonin gene-related peptide type 1 receptor-like [Mytilus californianus]
MIKNRIVNSFFLCWYFSQVTVVSSTLERKCHSRLGFHNSHVFELFSCAWCYEYLFTIKPQRQLFASDRVPVLYNPSKKLLISPDINNKTIINEVCSTLDNDECHRWKSCCVAANNCCKRQLSIPIGDVNETCGRTWDGWGCWDDTEKEKRVYLSCPLYLQYSLPIRQAVKTCQHNASWEIRDGREWTNYQPCLTVDDLKTSIFVGLGCSISSILVLFPSIFIFIRYQGLRKQHRVRLHINLFLSLLLKEIAVACWDMLVTYERITSIDTSSTVLAGNGAGCKILSFVKIYFKCASFTWMFCEGLFLHRLMSDAFSPPRSLIPFYVAGWTVPFITTLIYAILRAVYANESCWSTSYGHFEWIFDIPNLIFLAVNLIFLCNILRILLTQMQSHPNEPSNFRKALKAMFVLIPLFGIQLVVTIYRVPITETGGLQYERFSIIINNLQGFLVALIFCFLNNEVFSYLRRTWRRRIRDRGISHSRSKFNSTSVNMTLTSRAEGDFQCVHRSLFDKVEENGGDRISREVNEHIPCVNFKDDSLDNSCNRVLLSNNDA